MKLTELRINSMVEIITFYEEQNKDKVCIENSTDPNVETELLNEVTEFSVNQRGADIYHHDVTVVTLYKKPPCCQRIIFANIRCVFIS